MALYFAFAVTRKRRDAQRRVAWKVCRFQVAFRCPAAVLAIFSARRCRRHVRAVCRLSLGFRVSKSRRTSCDAVYAQEAAEYEGYPGDGEPIARRKRQA